jgi:predicted amidohydrolase
MTNDLGIATAQFENRSGDKQFNLATIEELSARAARLGASVVAFHECSITGYGFARRLSRQQLWDLAEVIPGGASIAALTGIARRHGIAVLAGLFERGDDGGL